MDISLNTALSERLGRIRAFNRALKTANHDHSELEPKDIAHLQEMMDAEINGALAELEAGHA